MQSSLFQTSDAAFMPNDRRRVPILALTAPGMTTVSDNPLPVFQGGQTVVERSSGSEVESNLHYFSGHERTIRPIEARHLLSNGLAHDLNNLFQVANTALSLIEMRSKLGREVDIPALVEKAELALDRAKTVVRRLTLLPVQSHSEVAPLDVNSVVLTLHSLFTLLAGSTIDVILELAPSHAIVACDRLDLENALLNIVANARNAIANGGMIAVRTSVEHRASVHAASKCSAYAVVTISDTGHGMTPEVASRAFAPFYSTRVERGGTGLGLAMVQRFLNDVGGSSAIESTVGIGTSVSIFLPMLEQSRQSDAT